MPRFEITGLTLVFDTEKNKVILSSASHSSETTVSNYGAAENYIRTEPEIQAACKNLANTFFDRPLGELIKFSKGSVETAFLRIVGFKLDHAMYMHDHEWLAEFRYDGDNHSRTRVWILEKLAKRSLGDLVRTHGKTITLRALMLAHQLKEAVS